MLVLNASGGVGSMAVQLARVLYDAEVVGTTGPNNLNFVRVSGKIVAFFSVFLRDSIAFSYCKGC